MGDVLEDVWGLPASGTIISATLCSCKILLPRGEPEDSILTPELERVS